MTWRCRAGIPVDSTGRQDSVSSALTHSQWPLNSTRGGEARGGVADHQLQLTRDTAYGPNIGLGLRSWTSPVPHWNTNTNTVSLQLSATQQVLTLSISLYCLFSMYSCQLSSSVLHNRCSHTKRTTFVSFLSFVGFPTIHSTRLQSKSSCSITYPIHQCLQSHMFTTPLPKPSLRTKK